jgi:hypothetical protein
MLAISSVEILKFLNKQKEILLAIYTEKGSIGLCGQNGPYKDQETGIRGQAHLIVLLSNLDKACKCRIHESIVIKLVNDILTSPYRNDKVVFIQRNKPGKDQVNGVIGIAWIIEAMSCAVEVYGLEAAREFLSIVEDGLKFDFNRALWYRPDVVSSKHYNTIDETFNHQLWLAYSLIYKSKVLDYPLSSSLSVFFERLNLNMVVGVNGLLKHHVGVNSNMFNIVKHKFKNFKKNFIATATCRSLKYKEYGYHLFNLYAFSRIENLGFGGLFSQNLNFKKILFYCSSNELLRNLMKNQDSGDFYMKDNNSGLIYNRYGYPYNVSGFEFLYVNRVFDIIQNPMTELEYWKAQLRCYDFDENGNTLKLGKVTEDEINLLLRSYELSYVLLIEP